MSVTTAIPTHARKRLARAQDVLTFRLAPERVAGPVPWGPDGWVLMLSWPRGKRVRPSGKVIVTSFPWEGADWVHASMSREGRTPSYEDLAVLRDAVFGDGWAYQLFAPPADHINIHDFTLHLWGPADGQPVLPNFGGVFGSI